MTATVEMVPCVLNGKYPLILPAHRAARPEWYTEEGWERARLDSMHDHLGPGDLIVDVGSEEMDMTALYSTWGADVVAIEPNPAVWPNGRAIWEANGLRPLVGWFVGFASDATVLSPPRWDPALAHDQDGWPSCAYGPVIGDHGFRTTWERAHDTPQVTLDDLCDVGKIVLGAFPTALSLDVEGGELQVLRGARRLLTELRPKVWVSVHPADFMAPYGYTPDDFYAYMAEVGYVDALIAEERHEDHHLFLPEEAV